MSRATAVEVLLSFLDVSKFLKISCPHESGKGRKSFLSPECVTELVCLRFLDKVEQHVRVLVQFMEGVEFR